METGLFIALLNPAISLVLASAFLLLWSYRRQKPYLAVLALAYAATAAGFLLQHFTLPVGVAVSRLVASGFFLFAGLCIASAISMLYGRKAPYVPLCVLAAGGLAGFSWFRFVEPDLIWRIYAVNFSLGGIVLIIMAELRAVPNKGPADKILFALAFLSGLNFFVRPLVLIWALGAFETYGGLHASVYWATTMLTHAVLTLLIALVLITAAVLDVLKGLEADSRTDPLSGLLNRRGFQERAVQMLQRPGAGKLPMALVLADLDHFKSVNDRFGHAAGDQVIAAFAQHLRSAAGEASVVARLGGEEFAVLLPACDLKTARLFAEGVRGSFSQGETQGLPAGIRLTASFGIAVPKEEEALPALLARADEALYQAKRSGRDSVCVSHRSADATELRLSA